MKRQAKVRIINVNITYSHLWDDDYMTEGLEVEAAVNINDGHKVTGTYYLEPEVYDFLGIRERIAKVHGCKLVNLFKGS
jgi:hypothetical protein